STSDVNIIFGTSINENLNDEVVVTVIATGIKDKDMPGGASGRPAQRPQSEQRSRPAQTENRERSESTSEQETSRQENQSTNDPFGNWDNRRETNLRDRNNADLDEKYENNQERGSNIFNRENENEVAKENDELDTPPFFRRRRRDD